MKSLKINQMSVGDSAFVIKTITSEDVFEFANLVGDHNPIHLDEEVAKKSIFGRRVVHGALVNSLFSGLLGTELPGMGAIYLKQETKFTAPTYINDTVTASVTVTEIDLEKGRVTLKTEAITQEGKVVASGFALVLVK